MIRYLDYVCSAITPTIYLQRLPFYSISHKNVRSFSLDPQQIPVVDLGTFRYSSALGECQIVTPSGEYTLSVTETTVGDYRVLEDASSRLFLCLDGEAPDVLSFTFVSPNASSFYFNGFYYVAFYVLEDAVVTWKENIQIKSLSFPTPPKNTSTPRDTGFVTPSNPYTLQHSTLYVVRFPLTQTQGTSLVNLFPFADSPLPAYASLCTLPIVGNTFINFIKWNEHENLFSGNNEVIEVSIPEEEYSEAGLNLDVTASSSKFALYPYFSLQKFAIDNTGTDTNLPQPPNINMSTLPGGYVKVDVEQILNGYVNRQIVKIGDENFVFPPRRSLSVVSTKKYPMNAQVVVRYQTMRSDGTIDIDVSQTHVVNWNLKAPDNLYVY